MGNWNSISAEIQAQNNKPEAYDIVRRQKLDAVQQITGRPLLIYAADFITPHPAKAQFASNLMSISLADKDSFDEVTRNLPHGKGIDIILHSPGGSAEATESIVELLRNRFSNIRFIIPNVAKSAATMMAMSGEQLLLDDLSELGPIDPQMIFVQDGRVIVSPVQAIKDQFKNAQDEINQDPKNLPVWVPILNWFGPSLLVQCDNHLKLAKELVTKWLQCYMFAGDPDATTKAQRIANYLADHNAFHSHERRVGIADLQGLEVNILDMRTVKDLHEAIRDLHIAIMQTFMGTMAYKIVENGQHEALIGMVQVNVPTQQIQQPNQQPTPHLNRQARRQATKKKR
jgi:hypothetical protein